MSYAAQTNALAATEKTRKANSLAKGAAAAVLTGGAGIQEDAPTMTKKLFGE
jgi:hypothetical protein